MTHSKERHALTTSSIGSTNSAFDFASSIYFPGQSADKKKLRSRKKSSYKHVPHYLKPAHLVAKRNARERLRVQAVKSAFVKLSKHVPIDTRHKKLSKLKTLRLAISYIQNLQELISEHDQFLNGKNYSPGIIENINQQNDVVLVDAEKQRENVGLHHKDNFTSRTNANTMNDSCRKLAQCESDAFNLSKGSYENIECIFIKQVDVLSSLSLDQSFTNNHCNGFINSEQICSNVHSAVNLTAQRFEDRPGVISSMFETYAGDIQCVVGGTVATKCYLNQHAPNHCVLSSCTPCRNMADHFLHI